MEFQVLTVVRLMTPDPRPPDGPDDDRIQAEHLAYLRGLGEAARSRSTARSEQSTRPTGAG